MPTNYPSGLDNFTNPTTLDQLDTPTVLHAAQHGNANDAIEAVQAELGLLPKGTAASVRARLDRADSLAGLPISRAYPISTKWCGARVPGISEAAGLNSGKALGAVHFVPFVSRLGFTADRIGCGAHSNSTDATMTVRLGIYADDGNFWPGARVLDAGTVNANAVSPTAAITISQALSANTLYWLVLAFQGTGTAFPNIKASGTQAVSGLMDIGAGTQDQIQNAQDEWVYLPASSITGALPSTFPARTTAAIISQAPILTLRAA